VRGIPGSSAQGSEKRRIEVGYTRNPVVVDRRAIGDDATSLAKRTSVLAAKDADG
jgi:hypothetical protein